MIPERIITAQSREVEAVTGATHSRRGLMNAVERAIEYSKAQGNERNPMTTLIVYRSRHGTTETCAQIIKAGLGGTVDLVDLKEKRPDPKAYDQVIIGGSIHAGRIQREVRRFCEKHADTLLTKRLGLFLCFMDEKRAREEFEANFPARLREHASAIGLLGGEFHFEKMDWFSRAVVRKIAGVSENVSTLSPTAIRRFLEDLVGTKPDASGERDHPGR